jgi:hypothetical protein
MAFLTGHYQGCDQGCGLHTLACALPVMQMSMMVQCCNSCLEVNAQKASLA